MTIALTLVLLTRLAGYVTVSVGDEAQSFKIGVRLASIAMVYGMVLMHAAARKRPTRVRLRRGSFFWLYVALLGLAAASLLYSSNVELSWLQLLMYAESLWFAYSFVWLVARTQATSELPTALFAALVLFVAACIAGSSVNEALFIKVTHGATFSRLGGLAVNANVLGMLTAIGVALGLYLVMGPQASRRLFVWGGLAVLAAGLVLTASRSAAVAVAAVALLFAIESKRPVLTSGVLLVLTIGAVEFGRQILFRTGDREEVMSMTGRLPFWGDLLTMAFPERPIAGFGFQCIWHESTFRSVHSYDANMAHNTFLQVLLGLGLVGLLVAAAQVISTVRTVYRIRNRQARFFMLGILIPLLINSITEFGIFGLANHAVALYQLVVMMLVFRLWEQSPGALPREGMGQRLRQGGGRPRDIHVPVRVPSH
jgi:exopolysaccharide production protein ExoQ